MSQECRCGEGCTKCPSCNHPMCECYCEDFFGGDDDMPFQKHSDSDEDGLMDFDPYE